MGFIFCSGSMNTLVFEVYCFKWLKVYYLKCRKVYCFYLIAKGLDNPFDPCQLLCNYSFITKRVSVSTYFHVHESNDVRFICRL